MISKAILWFCLTFILTALIAQAAFAHSWYDPECCSDRDCAPITEPLKYNSKGEILAKTKHGYTIIPRDHKIRPSKDEDIHVCMNIYIPDKPLDKKTPTFKFLCIYRPPGM